MNALSIKLPVLLKKIILNFKLSFFKLIYGFVQ